MQSHEKQTASGILIDTELDLHIHLGRLYIPYAIYSVHVGGVSPVFANNVIYISPFNGLVLFISRSLIIFVYNYIF